MSRGRSRSCTWTSTPSTPPVTGTGSGPCRWGGWRTAGWSPRRPPHSTSSARSSSATSNPANSSPSTRTGCAPTASRNPNMPPACSNTSTSPDPTASAPAQMGGQLAEEFPVAAGLAIATPESGTPAAVGYAEASGIAFGQGLMKNAYVGRTFIQPSQTLRQLGIRLKLNPLRENIEGKRLVVVDDSIVRGNTQRALVRMLREAGAEEIHVRISSPPVKWPCFYGIDFATRAELIANGLTTNEICDNLGADSLGYISLDG